MTEEMREAAGRAAWEAYRGAVKWSSLSPKEREEWRAIGQAAYDAASRARIQVTA